MRDLDPTAKLSGFLNPVNRHVLSGWARDPSRPQRRLRVELRSASGKLRVRLRADQPTNGPIGAHRFVCHLHEKLQSGELIHGRIVETEQPLMGAPRAVSPLESSLALYSPAHDYLVYYNAKSACTWLRSLFAFLHAREAQTAIDLHNLQPAFPPPPNGLPATALAVVRNPTLRIISCFLDKIVSWTYQPRISRAQDVLKWRFGEDQDRYPQLTFLDFLRYLQECPYPSDEHFWPQPIYDSGVWIAQVESLSDDILRFYGRFRPELLAAAETFIHEGRGNRNASRNTSLSEHLFIAGAENLGIETLADSIRAGIGIDPKSFLGNAALALLEPIVSREQAAYGYSTDS